MDAIPIDHHKRFWAKVEQRSNDCWSWMAATQSPGYGVFAVNRTRKLAHRVAYAIAYGPFEDSLFVCHRCDNPSCVRPDHLFLGTAADNTRDAQRKGRLGAPRKTHCPQGHSYDRANTYPLPRGRRACRACRNAASDWHNKRRRGCAVPAHWKDAL